MPVTKSETLIPLAALLLVVMSENYFDIDEEDAVHDAYLMIHDEDCEYDNMAEIVINETNLSAVVGRDLE